MLCPSSSSSSVFFVALCIRGATSVSLGDFVFTFLDETAGKEAPAG